MLDRARAQQATIISMTEAGTRHRPLAPVVGSGRRARLLVARPRDSCALGHEGMTAQTARRGGWRHACGQCRLAAAAAAGNEVRVHDLADAAERVAYALASSDSCVEFGTRIRVTDSGAADPRPRRPRPAWLDRTMRHTRSSTSVLACIAATGACTRPGHRDARLCRISTGPKARELKHRV
jgi:hypothetical protein